MDLNEIGVGIIYVVMGMVAILAAKLIKDLTTPFNVDEQLTSKDNPAYGLLLTGYFVGVTIIFLGASIGPGPAESLDVLLLAQMVGTDLAYAFLGILMLFAGQWCLDRFALPRFKIYKEVLEDRNVGTGAVVAGAMVATALTVAGAIHGEGGGPLSALVFFVLGQAVLILYVGIYQRFVSYDVHAEIEKDNVAAGVALGLNMVAMGVILMKGTAGDLQSWIDKLTWFFIDVGLGIVLLLILRRITDAVFLPKSSIQNEIANDQNINAAWVEGILSTSLATLIFFMG